MSCLEQFMKGERASRDQIEKSCRIRSGGHLAVGNVAATKKFGVDALGAWKKVAEYIRRSFDVDDNERRSAECLSKQGTFWSRTLAHNSGTSILDRCSLLGTDIPRVTAVACR